MEKRRADALPQECIRDLQSAPVSGVTSCITNRSAYIKLIRYWLPVLVWMVIIFSASGDTRSVQHTDSLLGRLFAFLHIHVTDSQLQLVRYLVRKGAHMAEFSILGMLWWRALASRTQPPDWSWRSACLGLGICVAYAVTDEVHQCFVANRTGHPMDVIIDTAGAAIGIAAIWVVRWFQIRVHSKHE